MVTRQGGLSISERHLRDGIGARLDWLGGGGRRMDRQKDVMEDRLDFRLTTGAETLCATAAASTSSVATRGFE